MISPLITAHTGADGMPDNSLEFVRYALTTAADALEIDIRPLKDGTLVLSHDEAGSNAVPLAEIFPLIAAHPSMKVNCDLKTAGLAEPVFRLAEACGLSHRLIYSGCVDADHYSRSDLLRERVEIYLNVEEYVPNLYRDYRDIPNFELQAAAQMTKVCHANGISTINIYQGLVTRRLIEVLKKEGIGVSAWTVNEPSELEWFLQSEVTNITTRNLQKALALR